MDKQELINQDIDSKKRTEQIKIEPNNTILFIGDSITDVNRDRMIDEDLGHGYPTLVAAHLLHKYPNYDLKILNRGISGDKVIDLKKRWEEDLREFEENYRYLLKSLAQRTDARVVLMEPFVLPYPRDRQNWRSHLDPRIQIVRRLANDYHAAFVPLDGIMNAKGIENDFQT